MKKGFAFLPLLLLIVLGGAFWWTQDKILNSRAGYRVEEKIMMLTNRPEVTKIAAMGFDNALADLFWIRAIQYFGGNFSTLSKPGKKEGLINLMDNMVGLDPHFVSAWKFGGFVYNDGVKDPKLAMDFLIRGWTKNPKSWRLIFDAGFIAFYSQADYAIAKQLFIQSKFGEDIAGQFTPKFEGNALQGGIGSIVDTDPASEIKFPEENTALALSAAKPVAIGRMAVQHHAGFEENFQISFQTPAKEAADTVREATTSGYYYENFAKPLTVNSIRLDHFKTNNPTKLISVSEVEIFGVSNADAPDYVERMAYEMDNKSGQFLVAWEQLRKYYEEAVKQGNEINAALVATKLASTFSDKCYEILNEAIKIYQQEKGKLPSQNMVELAQEGFLQRVIERKIKEDPKFEAQVLPVLMPGRDVRRLLFTFDGQTPHLLMVNKDKDGKEDWYVISRYDLFKRQRGQMDQLQEFVNTYKKTKGKTPQTLQDMVNEPWFSVPPDQAFNDPMGGEFFINQQTGKVEARNPKF